MSQEPSTEIKMVSELQQLFPEFVHSDINNKESDGLPYIIFGDFADYAIRELDKGNADLGDKILKYLNNTYEQVNDDGKNLLWVGFFENVSADMNWHKLLSNRLSDLIKKDYINFFGKAG